MKFKKILACFLLFLCFPLVYATVDTDNDGIIDSEDNCVDVFNPDQRDTNQDGYGNICDPDIDNDGAVTNSDGDRIQALYGLTPESPDWNPDADLNGDNKIEMSDVIIWTDMYGGQPGPSFGSNVDLDGWIDEKDNCPTVSNPDQSDTDGDGVGDVCEGVTTTSTTTNPIATTTTPETTTLETTTIIPETTTLETTTIPETTTTPITTTVEEETTTNPVFVPSGSAYFTEFPEKVEVFLNDSITVNVKFVSNLNYNFYDVEFILEGEGFSPSWYRISPKVEFKLEEGEEIDVSIEFNIPEDAEIYTYPITIKASGGSKIGIQTFSRTFKLLLKEKLNPLTTSSTTTTTTTVPEEEIKHPLSGLYSYIQSSPAIFPVIVIIVVIIILIYEITKPRSKGEYVYGKGWVRCIKTFKYPSTLSIKDLLTKW